MKSLMEMVFPRPALENGGFYSNGKLYKFDKEGNTYEYVLKELGPFMLEYYKKQPPVESMQFYRGVSHA